MRRDRQAEQAARKTFAARLANAVCVDVTFVNATTGHQVDGIWHLCTGR